MQNLKISQQCSLVCSSGTNKILQCFNQHGNQIVIYSTHIDFNGLVIGHDRNATAYQVHFTPDSTYAIIWVRNPNAIQVVNLRNKSADIYTIKNLQDDGSRIVAVTMQAEGEIKAGHNTRKLYFILQQRGNICLRVIQFQPKVQNNPKTRMRVIEQNAHIHNSQIKAQMVFSANRWNVFIIMRKQIMRVCRPVNRNNDIQFDFAIQSMQPKLSQLCSSSNIISIAQSSKTWALLCGNNINMQSRNNNTTDCNMVLNIFWQHYFNGQLIRYMYYKDQSYLKSVCLPCSEKDFIRMWQVNGYYVIQTISKNMQQGQNYTSAHCVHVIAEQASNQVVTFQMSRNSVICWNSLVVNSNQVSICEIVNQNQLNKIRIYQGPPPPNTQNINNINRDNTQNNNVKQQQPIKNQDNIQNNNAKQQQVTNNQQNNPPPKQAIKKFEPVQQTKMETVKQIDNPFNQNKISTDSTKQAELDKIAAKKNQSIGDKHQNDQTNQQNNAIKTLINEKLVQHLTGKQNGNSNQSDQQIEAPQALQSNISFGAPSEINKNKPKQKQGPNSSLISFGAPSIKQIKPNNALMSFGEPSTATPSTGSQSQNQNKMGTASTANTKTITPSTTQLSSPSIETKKTQNKTPVVQVPKFTKQQVKSILNDFKTIQAKYSASINEHFDVLKDNYQTINFNELVKFEPLFNRDQLAKLKNVQKGVKIFQILKQRKISRQQAVSQKCQKAYDRFKLICRETEKRLRILQISLYQSSSELQSLRKLINKHQKQRKKTLQQHIECEINVIATNILQLLKQTKQTSEHYRTSLMKQKQKVKKVKTKDIFQVLNQQTKCKEKHQETDKKKLRVPICRYQININMVPLIKLTPL